MNKAFKTYTRIIPKLDIKGPNLVKGIHLEGLRVLGKPEDFARIYYEEGADELIYIDLVASLYGRSNLIEIVQRIANRIFIPLTVGGGVRTLEDMHLLLRAGADKIAVNTALFENIDLLEKGAQIYGSQCMVVYIEAKKNSLGIYECMHTNARENSGIKVLDWAKQVEAKGAGEIFLTFVDTEGTGRGTDGEFIKQLMTSVSIPIIVNGGFGRTAHMVEALENGADAVAAASMFHYHALDRIKDSSPREKEGNTAYIEHKRSEHTRFLEEKIEPVGIQTVKNDIISAGGFCRMETREEDAEVLNDIFSTSEPEVVVVDYRMGNIFSLCRALKKVGAKVVVSNDPGVVSKAGYLVLPGVGAFPKAMENLENLGLIDPVRRHAEKGKPLLGICLGMQLLFSESEEMVVSKGLDIVRGKVSRLFKENFVPHPKLPHIGWNILDMNGAGGKARHNTLFASLTPGRFAYFVHSYAVKDIEDEFVLSMTEYGGERFCSAVQKDNVAGCQFHPEMSGTTGLEILKQFIGMK